MNFYQILIYFLAYIGLFAVTFYSLSLLDYNKKKRQLTSDEFSTTIIIPAYNEEKSIERTIKSALALDYPKEKIEIIVVNDGSTDNTLKIAQKFASSTLKVLHKKNGGKGSALNLGIKNARHEIIVTMDADSFVEPDALKKMTAFFLDNKVMAVSPSMGIYRPKGILQRVQQIEYYLGVFLRKSFASINAIHVTPGAFSAYRKSFFIKYGGYDENNLTEDLEIALRIQSKGYTIENASNAAVYTLGPNRFKELLFQRRRWYAGLARNLWNYKSLFGFKRGPLGTIVLPMAVVAVILPVLLTIYQINKSLRNLRTELISYQSIDFRFTNVLEYNSYALKHLFYTAFSSPEFLLSVFFISLLVLYLIFAKKQMRFQDSLFFSFIIFFFFYYFLFAFWWIVSFFYIIFNRKVTWREKKNG